MPLSHTPQEPQKVWEALLAGNKRFVHELSERPNTDSKRRYGLRSGQDPRVVVLSCSDSRAPVELVFDIGLGDAFVIRTAGHIVDTSVLASLEYAIENLGVNLVVVMGHQSCGAIGATAGVIDDGATIPVGFQRAIVEKISLAAQAVHVQGSTSTAEYEREHTRQTVDRLLANVHALQHKVDEGSIGVVGARYLLDDGRIEPVVYHGVE